MNISLTYLLTFAVLCYTDDFRHQSSRPVHLGLAITRICLALAGFLVCSSLPRRPDVYQKDHIVDRQRTAPALSRYTYAWLSPLLAFAAKQGFLRQADLPALDGAARARDLHDAFAARNNDGDDPARPLWKKVARAHAPALAMQYSLTALDSVLIVAPQAAMFRLLALLEERRRGADVALEAGLWVCGLGLGILVQNFFENWRWWVSYGSLNVPIRVQLSALIFAKAMRRKDVKGVSQREEGEVDGEEAMKQTQQGTVNLVGVDTKRVADYVTYQNGFLGAAIKIVVSFVFIYKLVG